jgi:hypothetical protein
MKEQAKIFFASTFMGAEWKISLAQLPGGRCKNFDKFLATLFGLESSDHGRKKQSAEVLLNKCEQGKQDRPGLLERTRADRVSEAQ